MRSPYSDPGSIRLIVTLGTFPEGGRPSDCAITAAGTV